MPDISIGASYLSVKGRHLQRTRDINLPAPVATQIPITGQLSPVILTYLPHPGTAVYVGYNSDWQNFDRSLTVDPLDPDQNLLRVRNHYLQDGRAVFVKVSYLFRY